MQQHFRQRHPGVAADWDDVRVQKPFRTAGLNQYVFCGPGTSTSVKQFRPLGFINHDLLYSYGPGVTKQP